MELQPYHSDSDSHDAANGPEVRLVAVTLLLQHLRGDVVGSSTHRPAIHERWNR